MLSTRPYVFFTCESQPTAIYSTFVTCDTPSFKKILASAKCDVWLPPLKNNYKLIDVL